MNKTIPQLILLSLTTFLVACESSSSAPNDSGQINFHKPDDKKSKLLSMAEKMRETGDFQTALKFYQQSLNEEDWTPEALFGVARCLAKMGKGDEALETLRKAAEHYPDHPEIHIEYGIAYLEMQKPKECIYHFNVALASHAHNITVLNGLGVCHDLQKDHLKAREFYLKALQVNPRATFVSANLGLSYTFSRGTIQKAISVLEPIAKSAKASAKDRQNLALAYGLSGNIKKAAQLYSIDLSDTEVQSNIDYIKSVKDQQWIQGSTESAEPTPREESVTPIEIVPIEPVELAPTKVSALSHKATAGAILKQPIKKINTRRVDSGHPLQSLEDSKEINPSTSDVALLEAEALLM